MKNSRVTIPKNSFIYFQLVYPKIIETIRLVASSPKEQISAFSKTENPPEEIGDLVEMATLMAQSLCNSGFISNEKFNAVRTIDEKFTNFPKQQWTIEALKNSKEWEDVRESAKNVLKIFSIEYAKPNLYWYWEK